MFHRLRDILLGNGQSDERSATAGFDETAFATAALMSEAAQLDGRIGDKERQIIGALLRSRFDLDESAADALLAAAGARVAHSQQILPYTRTIKDRLTEAERIEVIEMLWEVIYADGGVHDYEAGLMRRIAGLIYVQDVDMGAARKRVLARLGQTETDTGTA